MEPLDIRAVLQRLPHRYPFLLVDRVVERVPGERVLAYKNVTIDEPFFQGHFPDYPVMPGVLIIEALAQAAGLALPEGPGPTLGLLTGIDHARIRRPVVPGDRLDLAVHIVKQKARLIQASGRAEVDGRRVGEADILFMLLDGPTAVESRR